MKRECVRCRSTKDLEEDHIKPKHLGGADTSANKRILCEPCHNYRHARDKVIAHIEGHLSLLGTEHFSSVRFSMWIMRLGVLEAFNTPKRIREKGYTSYFDVPTTHYTYWYPQIKLQRMNREAKEAILQKQPKISDFRLDKAKILGGNKREKA